MTELLDGARHHAGDIGFVGDVGSHRDRTLSGRGGRLLDQLFSTGGQEHLGAFANEQRTHHRSEPGARPGDDRDLPVQSSTRHRGTSPNTSRIPSPNNLLPAPDGSSNRLVRFRTRHVEPARSRSQRTALTRQREYRDSS